MQKKTQRPTTNNVTSEAFQRVKYETLQESHLKFGTTDEAQNFELKKTRNYGKQNKLLKTKTRNVLASKLRRYDL